MCYPITRTKDIYYSSSKYHNIVTENETMDATPVRVYYGKIPIGGLNSY